MWGAIIGAVASLATNVIGSHIANKRKAEAEKAYQDSVNDQIDELNTQINSDYLQSAEAQNALRKVTDSNTEAMRQLNTDAIRGGASDEAKIAMANKLSKGTADVVGDLAALGERKKDALRNERRGLQTKLAEHKYAQDSDTSGISNIVSSISSAANVLGNAIGGGIGASAKGGDTSAASATGAASTSATSSSTTMPNSDPNTMFIKNGSNLADNNQEDQQYYYGKNDIIF
jgi:hypothetical protein